MRSRLVLAAAIAALGAASGASAQFTVTPGGALAGNGYFAQGTQPTSLTSTGIGSSNFGATSATVADQLFQDWWWFRGPGDTREFTFANGAAAGGPTAAGTLVGTNTGNLDTGGYDYTVTNSTAGYAFTAQLRWQIFGSGAGPYVVYSANIINNGNNPLALSMFHYNDFDANGTTVNTWSFADNAYTITAGAVTLYHGADGFTARQSTQWSALRGLLSNTAVDNLNNTDVGTPGDYTSGFQWDLNIAAGGSQMITGFLGFAVPAPGAAALLGLGGLAAARRRR